MLSRSKCAWPNSHILLCPADRSHQIWWKTVPKTSSTLFKWSKTYPGCNPIWEFLAKWMSNKDKWRSISNELWWTSSKNKSPNKEWKKYLPNLVARAKARRSLEILTAKVLLGAPLPTSGSEWSNSTSKHLRSLSRTKRKVEPLSISQRFTKKVTKILTKKSPINKIRKLLQKMIKKLLLMTMLKMRKANKPKKRLSTIVVKKFTRT